MRRFLIRGLKKEYIPFVTSIQGWAHQPSVEELESLLSNQEALAKQMAKSLDPEVVLFSKGKQDCRVIFKIMRYNSTNALLYHVFSLKEWMKNLQTLKKPKAAQNGNQLWTRRLRL
ncbi:hypothetical protein V6N11_039122 [Hibiscus sabdariffa]|uniref:Uncharacterized protein n=1 Tax=Hibiscus sabdariffa TaxID=183260 RepID=A0ABR2SM31_9ROSI